MVVMKGADPHIFLPFFIQRKVAGYDIDDIALGLDGIQIALIYSGDGNAFLIRKTECVPEYSL